MRRTADRRAEAARAQQITDQRVQNHKTLEQMAQEARLEQATVELVQDRKTGEWYNPQEAFDKLMNKPEIQAVFKRLAVR
jgi:hypothetical protein